MKKRANISREAKTLEWMHKTSSKTKRKKSIHINTRKKNIPHTKKSLAIREKMSDCFYMDSRTQLNIRKTKFTI
jgi:hypothetical protein